MNLNKFFQSKIFKTAVLVIGALIILLMVFKAGEFAGYRKARFSYSWAENYHHNFGGPRGGFLRDFYGKDYMNANGIFGSIIKIDGNTLVIKGRDDIEKTVLISDKTDIKSHLNKIMPVDLKIDDRIIVIGSPNEQGHVEAKFIRLFR